MCGRANETQSKSDKLGCEKYYKRSGDNRTLFSHANRFQLLRGEINLAQGFERFHSLTVALERGTERRSVGTTTAQVPSPPERWDLLHSHSSPHSPLAASPIPSCASHISIYKINRLTKEPLSRNKFKYLLQMGRGRKTEH